jgi:hypothetical protein
MYKEEFEPMTPVFEWVETVILYREIILQQILVTT